MKAATIARGLLLGTAWLACGLAYGQAPVRLVEAWRLSDGMNRPESVVYDAAHDVLYVSNINGDGGVADGNGYLSRVSTAGELLDSVWVGGLDAPKGLALSGGRLYVADLDELVVVDPAAGAVVARYPATGADAFLNDVDAAADGTVYVTDSRQSKVYRLQGQQFEVWLDDPNLRAPNGVHAGEDGVLVAAGDTTAENPGGARYLQVVSPADRTLRPFADRTPHGALDAIEPDGHGGYFLTDWVGGRVLYATADGRVELLQQLGQGTADLDYVAAQEMIYLPVMMSDVLIAYRVERTP